MSANRHEGIESEDLLRFIDQIEKLEEEKRIIQDAMKDVYSESTASGFDSKIIRQLVRLRRMDNDKFREHEVLLALYKKALGMLITLHDVKQAYEDAVSGA